MKLELKHIVGYLPYGLKIRSFREGQILFIEDIIASGEFLDYLFEKTHSRLNSTMIYKPILRPLSDLTKEIEVNGEKFVPTQEYDYLRFEEISTLKSGCNALKFIQARELDLLYEMHFDIHGLIENNLAIDINTL